MLLTNEEWLLTKKRKNDTHTIGLQLTLNVTETTTSANESLPILILSLSNMELPPFTSEMPIGVVSSIHNMCTWLKYSDTQTFDNYLTAQMVCAILNDNNDIELSLKNLLI